MVEITRRKALRQITGGLFASGFLATELITDNALTRGSPISGDSIEKLNRWSAEVADEEFDENTTQFERNSFEYKLAKEFPEIDNRTISKIGEDFKNYNAKISSTLSSIEGGIGAYSFAGSKKSIQGGIILMSIFGCASVPLVRALDKKPDARYFQSQYGIKAELSKRVADSVAKNINIQYRESIMRGAFSGMIIGKPLHWLLDKAIPGSDNDNGPNVK